MKHPQFVRGLLAVLVFAGIGLRAGLSSAAEGGAPFSLVSVVTADAQGRPWAYLSWQASGEFPQPGRLFAVYRKPGDAGANVAYQRVALVGSQTDPLVLTPILSRAEAFGQNLAELEAALDEQFAGLPPAVPWTLAQKLSALFVGAQKDPAQAVQRQFLGRVYPAVAMCLGQAHAELIPGPVGAKTTFELRLFEVASSQDLGVLGRVTATAGVPVVLPAPDRPVEVRDVTPQGDLNLKWRWATPPELRRLSLLQHGFNVWRMTRSFAVQNGYHLAPPSTATLRQLAISDPNVRRLNRGPVLAEKPFTALDVGDFVGDPATRYFADDNDQGDAASPLRQTEFVNGSQFYYFVTARDLLGRDGAVSGGTLGTVCDRLPPPPPPGARVVNHYTYDGQADQAEQRLRVIWQQNRDRAGETVTAYFVYRWTSIDELHAHGSDVGFNLIAGPIPHLAGSPTNGYVDNGPGAPSFAHGDVGKTFWYTVVAVDAAACAPGANRSQHSAPVWGVLRDRVGPAGGGGRVEIACSRPVVAYAPPAGEAVVLGLDTNSYHYRTTLQAPLAQLAVVEFTALLPDGSGGTRVFARRWMGTTPDQTSVVCDFAISKTNVATFALPSFTCRVTAMNGKVSNLASSPGVLFSGNARRRLVPFTATWETTFGPAERGCDTHDPNPPGVATNLPICLRIFTTSGAKEFHLYRRVDDGPLTLISQGEADHAAGQLEVVRCDDSLPANPAEVCYFAQLFDEHGNPGPLQRIGCTMTGGAAPLPRPVLAELERGGTTEAPTVTVRWFYPPYPVERFEVLVAAHPQAPNAFMFPGLGDPATADPPILMDFPAAGAPWEYTRILTRRVGPGFGLGPNWALTGAVLPANHYAVMIRAIGKSGELSPFSNLQEFEWGATRTPGAGIVNVPWPARGLLTPSQTNFPHVAPRVFQNDNGLRPFEGLAVRIGEISQDPVTNTQPNQPVFVAGHHDPASFIYRSAQTQESLLPLAMYRYQVPSAAFPTVSGDVVQVSPLMEQIAFDRTALAGFPQATVIHDPFIRVAPVVPGARRHGLYLVDTQPVVRGAAYRYVLVRHDSNKLEPGEIVVTTSVEVPQ